MPAAKQQRSTRLAAAAAAAACVGGASFAFAPSPILSAADQATSAGQSSHASAAARWAKASLSDGQRAAAAGVVMAGGAAALATGSLGKKRSSRERRQARTACCARGGAKAPLVVISGPPAAGKGTQCEKIKEKYGYVHISTGDMLRENVKNGTELGKKAKGYMEAGALVPSELLVDIVKDRLAQPDVQERGCLLDGFPRAPDQAQAMVDAGLNVEKFLLIEVPDEELVVRGVGRRLDPETGEIYHMTFKPPPADIVDRLVHRSDDQEEAIRNRLKIYRGQVDDILPFFKDVVTEIDGLGKPTEVFDRVTSSLDSL